MDETELRQRKAGGDRSNNDADKTTSTERDESARTVSNTAASPVPSAHNYGSAAEYAEAVRAWLWAYHSWQLSQCLMPFFMQQQQLNILAQQHQLSSNIQQSQQLQQLNGWGPTAPSFQQTSATVSQRTAVVIRPGGVQHTIPAFGRRVLAEIIDCSLCFLLSLFVTYMLVESNVIDLDKYEKLFSYQADLKTFIDITQDLFPLEVAKRILTSVLEATFIAKGFGRIPPGQTPGKFLLGLKVITCQEVTLVSARDHRVVIHPSTGDVTFSNALSRSLIKNFALGFLFPVCVVMFTFRHNRAVYDLASNTIVVEAER